MTPVDTIRPQLDRAQSRAFVIGGAFLVLAAIGALIDREQFFRSYLVGFMFWTGIVLGSFAIVMLHHLAGGRWGFAIRRLLESATRTLPLLLLLAVPLLFGLGTLYEWARPEVVAHDAVLQRKALYLNVPFFLLRLAIYFAIWFVMMYLLNKWSAEQDTSDDPALVRKLQNFSGPGLVLYGLTVTFLSIDLLMSLQPHWFSTIFGMIIMCGQGVSTLAFMIAVATLMAQRTPYGQSLSTVQYHDLGNLLLAFVMLWAYTSFAQLLLIYSGNLPEEIPYYLRRFYGAPGWIGVALIVFHFAIPLLLLLSRDVKRHLRRLAAVSVWLLIMRVVDLLWVVKPAGEGAHIFHWLDIVVPLGIGGVWVGFFVYQLKKRPLAPLHDPRLETGESHG